MMNRIGARLDQETPITQAAYRKQKSQTKVATKVAIERTITSKTETLHLVMLDMSKVFDRINRKVLLDHLRNTIHPDELHIVKKMLEVTLAVRCGQSISETFTTDTGATQVEHLNLDMEYDMTKLTSDFNKQCLKNEHDAEVNLGKNGLKMNNKTERFTIDSTMIGISVNSLALFWTPTKTSNEEKL